MSKISYSALAVDGLRDVLEQVSSTCNELGIDFFIVGAIARNIWYVSHGKLASGTKDVDLGIYISNEQQYNRLRSGLIRKYAYKPCKDNAFCLITAKNKQVDLLPFGEIANENMLMIEGKGLIGTSLPGFTESYKLGLVEAIIGEDRYLVCSIPAIVVLKLIAYDDRPEYRMKDVKDINSICQYYPDIESEFIWSNHFDLYGGDKEHQEVAMIVLGREIKKIIEINQDLKNRILNIINKAINQETPLLNHMVEDSSTETLDMKIKILQNIKRGIGG